METREVSGGNSVTGKCSNTACGAQLRGYTHTYTDIDVHTGRENTHIHAIHSIHTGINQHSLLLDR